MKSVVIDSSVFLAIVNLEEGHESLYDIMTNSIMSSVNVAEVSGILRSRKGISKEKVDIMVKQLVSMIIPFNETQAFIAGELEVASKEQSCNLSLADRACIALGINMNLPIYTGDRIWGKLVYKDANIRLFR